MGAALGGAVWLSTGFQRAGLRDMGIGRGLLSGRKVYPAGKVGSHGSWLSMAVQRPARFGKGTSDVLPHCAANQLDQQIWA